MSKELEQAAQEGYRRSIESGCLCCWANHGGEFGGTPVRVHTEANCPIHNSQSLDRQIDYGRIEEIVRRVVREEKGR